MEKRLVPRLIVRGNYLKISPQKMQPIVDLVRGKEIDNSLNTLRFLPQKGAKMLHKILQGARKQVLHKEENEKTKKNSFFYISKIKIDRGSISKKIFIRAKGSADTLRKVNCHLFLSLSKEEKEK